MYPHEKLARSNFWIKWQVSRRVIKYAAASGSVTACKPFTPYKSNESLQNCEFEISLLP